jgi:hypothetical protein
MAPLTPPTSAPTAAAFTPTRRRRSRTEILADAVFWILVGSLVIAAFTLLLSLNSIISIWFREQWAPIARAVASVLVIVGCAWGLVRLTRRRAAASEAYEN